MDNRALFIYCNAKKTGSTTERQRERGTHLLLSTGGGEALADGHLALNRLVGDHLGLLFLLGLTDGHGHHANTATKE